MEVPVIVADNGDGWLEVDTGDWLAHKLGERDEVLTLELTTWQDAGDVPPADCEGVTAWARERFVHVTGPGRDDEYPVGFHSANQDSILSDDICVTVLKVRDRDEMTLAVVNHRDVHVLAPGQEWTDAVDWSRAWGGCSNGHTYTVEAACYLAGGNVPPAGQVARYAVVPDADSYHEAGYIACPTCGQPLSFTT